MAITLVLGEGSEEAFLAKLEDWLKSPLSEEEKKHAASLRSIGFAVSYCAWKITESRTGGAISNQD